MEYCLDEITNRIKSRRAPYLHTDGMRKDKKISTDLGYSVGRETSRETSPSVGHDTPGEPRKRNVFPYVVGDSGGIRWRPVEIVDGHREDLAAPSRTFMR
jgi:hypothetical protein